MIDLVFVDGAHHIQLDGALMPLHDVPKAIHDGVFDEHRELVPHVVSAYLKVMGKPVESCLVPILRYYLVCDAVDWVQEVSGGLSWTYGKTTIPVSIALMRIGFAAQIEGDLAASNDGRPLEWKIYKYYTGMKDWGTSDGLNDFGKQVVRTLLDTTAKAHGCADTQELTVH